MSEIYSEFTESLDLANSILETKVNKISSNVEFIDLKKKCH